MTGPEQKNENTKEQTQENQIEIDAKKIESINSQALGKQMNEKNPKTPEANDIKSNDRDKIIDAKGNYQPKYTQFINDIVNNPELLQKVISESKLSYVTDKDSFVKFATDHKLGDLHQYLKNSFPNMEIKTNSFEERLKDAIGDYNDVPVRYFLKDRLQETPPMTTEQFLRCFRKQFNTLTLDAKIPSRDAFLKLSKAYKSDLKKDYPTNPDQNYIKQEQKFINDIMKKPGMWLEVHSDVFVNNQQKINIKPLYH